MGRHYQFYLEEKTEQGWQYTMPDSELLTESKMDLCINPFHQLAYVPYIDGLFLGRNPLFEFSTGIPQDIDTELFKHITNDHHSKHWFIKFEELMVNDWGETLINVSQAVEQSQVSKFVDGRQTFSREQLLVLPLEFDEIEDFPGKVRSHPIDFQANPQSMIHPSFEGKIDVSWRMKLSDFLPSEFVKQMHVALACFDQEKLRLYIVYHDF